MQKRILGTLVLIFLLLTTLYIQGKKEAWAERALAFQSLAKPQRIVSLSLSADEILLALVEPERIAALTYLSIDPGISNVASQAAQVKEHIYADTEKVISLRPDLVVTSSFTPDVVIQTLRQSGLRVYVFPLGNSLAQVKENILGVAEAVGEKEKGQEVIKQMETQEAKLAAKIKSQSVYPYRILYYGLSGNTNGQGTQFDELVQMTGLRNVAAEAGIIGRGQVDKEMLIRLNPDVILLPTWTLKVQKADFDSAQKLMDDPSLALVEAVKNKRVYALPDPHFSCCSQNIVLAMEDLWQLALEEKKSKDVK